MSRSKLKNQPIAVQIANYEHEIKRIEERIKNGKERIKELQRHIRRLQHPQAEERHKERLAQSENDKKRKNEPRFRKGMSKEARLNAIFDFIDKKY